MVVGYCVCCVVLPFWLLGGCSLACVAFSCIGLLGVSWWSWLSAVLLMPDVSLLISSITCGVMGRIRLVDGVRSRMASWNSPA